MAANDRQEGGAHYRTAIQHWDYVLANGLGYLEGQITKYVTRWRKKNGIEDLKKASHFLDKLIEVAQAEAESDLISIPAGDRMVRASRVREWMGFVFEGAKDGTNEFSCKHCRTHVWVPLESDPMDAHGHCPEKSYVSQ